MGVNLVLTAVLTYVLGWSFSFPHCFFSARKGISVGENVEMREGIGEEDIRGGDDCMASPVQWT